MPRKQHNELLAGLVVILSLAAIVGVVVWLGAADSLRPAARTLVFYSPHDDGDTGIRTGAAVTVGSTEIGRVSDMRPLADKTVIVVRLSRADLAVHSDAKAEVSIPMVGTASLVLKSLGTPDAPLADDQHMVRASLGGLAGLMNNTEKLDRMMDEMSVAVATVSKSITRELDPVADQALLHKIHSMMGDLSHASKNVADLAGNVLKQTDTASRDSLMSKVLAAAGDVQAMTADARPKVERTLTSVESIAGNVDSYTKKDVAAILKDFREVNTKVLAIATDLQAVSGQAREILVVNRDRVDAMIDDMSQVSSDLKATAKEVRRSPWRLLYQPKPDEVRTQNIQDAARAFSTGAEQLDRALAKLKALAAVNTAGLKADDPELVKIRKDVSESFDNFEKVEQSLWKELAK